jgi:hypothetical protein
MAELTNLTDRLAHLRDREIRSPVIKGNPSGPKPPQKKSKKLPERRFATDYFMFFVYALLAIALLTQFVLIAWLDFV